MPSLTGKVAFITGVARGQGRTHAVRLAREGANIIGLDICGDIPSVPYPLATEADMAETVKLVEDEGGKIVTSVADVRDREALQRAFEAGVAQLGPIDIVLANAGIWAIAEEPEWRQASWQDSLDVMLTGTFNTLEVTVPSMIERNVGGSILITSSTAGLKAAARDYDTTTSGRIAYTVAKHGLVGLMRTYANTLAKHSIRVNTIHPTGVNTGMIRNEAAAAYGANHMVGVDTSHLQNALPLSVLEPEDVSNAVAWLCSDEARYITGSTFTVDAGFLVR
jgi:SDR family mycofactocin-dependent oxidoreductase